MSIISKVKNIFGIADEEYDYKTDQPDTEHTPYINPFKTVQQPTGEDNCSAETLQENGIDSAMNKMITDRIIEIINAGLPEFIKNCIDKDAEAQHLDSLFGNTLKEYSSQLKSLIEERAKREWQTERMNLEQETATAAKQKEDLAKRNEDLRNRIMSLERQKTTLNEQTDLLKNKIATAEAEREQFQLECKSLLNKLKVSNVNEQEIADLKTQNATLQQEANALRSDVAQLRNQTADENKKLEKEKETLKLRIAELETIASTQPTAQQELIESLQTEIKKQTDEIYALKDLRNEHLQAIKDLDSKLSQTEKERNAESLRNSELLQLLQAKENELEAAKKAADDYKNFAEQMKGIADSNKEIQRATEDSLRQEIKLQKARYKELANELEKQKEKKKLNLLFSNDDTVPEKPVKKERAKKQKQVISAIDYTTDSTDWLMPTPPTEAIPIETAEELSGPASAQQKRPTNPAQMELF